MTTVLAAQDIVMGALRTAWLANPTSAPVKLLWDNVAGDKPPPPTAGRAAPWARAAMRHNTGAQDSFAAIGRRRYLTGGVFTVQLFTPLGDGGQLAGQLVAIVEAALRAIQTTSQVWFFDIQHAEIGEDGPWFNTNVDATFRYQERA